MTTVIEQRVFDRLIREEESKARDQKIIDRQAMIEELADFQAGIEERIQPLQADVDQCGGELRAAQAALEKAKKHFAEASGRLQGENMEITAFVSRRQCKLSQWDVASLRSALSAAEQEARNSFAVGNEAATTARVKEIRTARDSIETILASEADPQPKLDAIWDELNI